MLYKHIININNIKIGMRVADDIFAITNTGANMLIVPGETMISEKIFNLLHRHNIKQVPVLSRKPPAGHQEQPPEEQEKEPLPEVVPILTPQLRQEAITSIRELFRSVHDENNKNMTTAYHAIQGLDRILNQLVSSVTSDARGIVHIHDLKRYDEYTYHHSLSVAVLSIAIGQVMGLELMDLVRLSRAAVLHDIGKLAIPLEILNKRQKLTTDEFKVIKGHAAQGYLNLKNKAYGDTELWNTVMFHHEKINGKGYPKGLMGNEIPLFSKIISVADVYDAVTSHRPYREPMTPSEAYELVMGEAGTSFEHDIVMAFLRKLVLYPINTVLELSDRNQYIVVDITNGLRPVVKNINTGEMVDLNNSKNFNLTISKVVNPNEKRR